MKRLSIALILSLGAVSPAFAHLNPAEHGSFAAGLPGKGKPKPTTPNASRLNNASTGSEPNTNGPTTRFEGEFSDLPRRVYRVKVVQLSVYESPPLCSSRIVY